nr:hypothetical protein [Tanacetum cinerariifolium]
MSGMTTYQAVAIGAEPPKPNASVRRTRSSFDITITPPTAAAGPRLTTSAKGKQAAKAFKAKNEGTGSIPGVPDVPSDESEEELSWNSTNKEGDDDEGNNDDGNEEDEGNDDEDHDVEECDNNDDDQEVERDDEKDDEETMDTTIDQQVAMDEALVLTAQRLKIRMSNFRLLSDIKSKESTLQLVYDVLCICPFFKAFLVTSDVPEIYMQEF